MANFKALTMQGGFHTSIQNANKVNVGSGIDANVVQALSIGDTNANAILIGHPGLVTTFTGGVSQSGGAFNVTASGDSTIATAGGFDLTLQSGNDIIFFENDSGNSIFQVKGILENVVGQSGTLTTNGETLVLIASATGIRTGPAMAGYDLQIDGVLVGSINTFRTTATAEHVAMSGTIVNSVIASGAHTFAFVAQAGTTVDANDRFSLTVLGLPVPPSL